MAIKTIQILLVDDDPNLRATMSDILKFKGFVPIQAGTGATALEMAGGQEIDVALIDLQLEDMPGLDLMRALKKQSPGIESILLTGHASQSSAIEAVNAGAYSYFQKPADMDQLVLSIQRAAEKKAAEAGLRESEASLQAVLDSTADGILAVNRENKVLYANRRFTELWHIPSEVMESHADAVLLQFVMDQLVDPDKFLQKVQELYQSDKEGFDTILFKDGRVFERQSRQFMQEAGLQGRVWSFHDVTEQKRTEAQLRNAEQKYRSIFENATEGIHQTTPDGKIISVNPAGVHILGFDTAEEMMTSANLLEARFYVQPGRRDEFMRLMETNGSISAFESEVYRKDGSIAWLSENAHTVCDEHGNVLYYEGTSVDITERKRTEEALRESEERFRVVFEQAKDGIAITNAAEQFLEVNSRMCEIVGYSRAELLKMRVPDVQAPEIRKTGEEQKNAMVRDGKVLYEGLDLHRSGRRVPVEISAGRMLLPSGELYVSIVRDITERKRAEMELLASREAERVLAQRLTILSEITTELSKADSLDDLCRQAVEMGRERLNFDRLSIWFVAEDHITLLGTFGVDTEGNFTDERKEHFTIGPDIPSWSLINDQVPFLLRKDVPLALKGKMVGQGMHVSAGLWDGKTVIGYISLDNLLHQQPFTESDCEIIRLYASALGHLISIKRAERELRTSEERYRMLAENMTDTIWLLDLNLKTTYISPSVTKLRGYTLEEINTIPLDQQMSSDSFTRLVKTYVNDFAPERISQIDQYISTTLELEFIKKDGDSYWSENTLSLIRSPQGEPLAILGSGREITERKNARAALELSEKRFRALIENNTDAIVLVDTRGLILYESPAYARMMGRESGKRLGRSSFEFIHPDDRVNMATILHELTMARGETHSTTLRNLHADGNYHWLEVSASNMLGEPAVQAIVVNMHDITERKKAEEALVTTERIYRQAITRTGGVPYQMDYESQKYVFLGEGIQSLTGYLPSELDEPLFTTRLRQIESFGEQKDLPHDERIRLAREGNAIKEWREDYMFERKNGSLVWLADHAVQLKDAEGNPTGSLGILMDITQRKQAEENIRQRVAELEVLYETGLSLSRLLEPKEIGRKVIETLAKKLSWRHASISLYHPESQSLELLVLNHPGLSTRELRSETRRLNKTISKLGEGFSGWVIAHGESIRSGEVKNDPRFIPTFKNIRSGLYVPMRVGEHITGVIGVESEQAESFSEADERLLKTLATQAGIAIENGRLLEETRRQVDELGTLADISSALRTANTRSEIISAVLDLLMTRVFKADKACLEIYDAGTSGNVVEAARGGWKKRVGLQLKPGEGLSSLMDEAHQPYHSNNIQSEERLSKEYISEQPEAVAGVPLLIRGEYTGSLWVGRLSKKKAEEPPAFTLADLHLLESVADMTANALHRASLYEQIVRNAEDLLTINTLGRVLGEMLDLDQIYEKLDEIVRLLLDDISLVAISRFDAEKQQIVCAWLKTDEDKQDAASLPPVHLEPPGSGSQSEAVHTRQPVIIGDLRERLKKASLVVDVGKEDGRTTRSGLYVPMLVHGQVIGVMQVQSCSLNRFSQPDADLLSLVANTAAVAIENARLFSETQKQLHNLAALHAIETAISASVDINVTLNILLEQTIAELNVDAAAILLFNSLARTLDYVASLGFRHHRVEGTQIPFGVGLVGQAALHRQIQSASDLPNTKKAADHRKSYLDIYEGEGFVTHHAIPLVAKGHIQGVLEVLHRSPFQPDEDWFTFLETLSRQAAIAIDNTNLFDNLQRSNTNIIMAYDATIQGWSQALELRDKETEGHAQRVTELTVELARLVGVPEAELEHVRRGTLLHDIGKMGIPDAILLKPGKLTDQEWKIMRQHPVYAYEMLSSIAYLRPALDIPHYHHERWNGSGYPDGLKGELIPLYARVFAVVDVFDALTNNRSYRKAWTADKAIKYIREQSGAEFDPAMVQAFLGMLESGKM